MPIKPTNSELEILQILWKKGQCTVREVNEELAEIKNTDIGYTTTLKLMQIMHDKGLLERDASIRTHIYKALLSQAKTSQSLLRNFIETVYSGSATQLIMQALGDRKSSPEEIRKIKAYLEELEKK